MAVNSSNINATDLDFDAISENIKTYLKGQDKFKDYDFEGSTMSVLIDTLAYATHISGVNTNIAASELFLDSAQIRKNVGLGYVSNQMFFIPINSARKPTRQARSSTPKFSMLTST